MRVSRNLFVPLLIIAACIFQFKVLGCDETTELLVFSSISFLLLGGAWLLSNRGHRFENREEIRDRKNYGKGSR